MYCYAVYEENLHDIEAALIYKNQPLANTQNKDKYNGTIILFLLIVKVK